MSEMVTRVARAICVAKGIDPDFIGELPNDVGAASLDHAFPQWGLHLDQARAAIAAMREPTGDMATAGTLVEPNNDNDDGLPTADEVWRAMIDAALK